MTSDPASRDPTRRFSDRVDDYVRYRPSYPVAAVDLLRERCGLGPETVAADVGSGTGKLTEVLIDAGFRVLAVEPNAEMRAAAEDLLGSREGFVSVDGTAEATTLPAASVDLVTVAQAFHWFDQKAARIEFRRILRRSGHVALLWNDRMSDTSLADDYGRILREFSVDYETVNRQGKSGPATVDAFFVEHEEASFPNPQETDFSGLVGRYLSASYAYRRDDPRFPRAETALRDLFDKYEHGGRLCMPLETRLTWGRV